MFTESNTDFIHSLNSIQINVCHLSYFRTFQLILKMNISIDFIILLYFMLRSPKLTVLQATRRKLCSYNYTAVDFSSLL